MSLSFATPHIATPRIQSPCVSRRATITHRLTVTVRAWKRTVHSHPTSPHHPPHTQQAFATSPWQTLGVAPGATADSIKRAYRKQALKLHPDVNSAPDASARFIELQHAYEQLCKGTEHDHAWEPTANMGQRGCRAVWERQVAGCVYAGIVYNEGYDDTNIHSIHTGLQQRPRVVPRGSRRGHPAGSNPNLASQLAGLGRRRSRTACNATEA